jgi:transposase-like protein
VDYKSDSSEQEVFDNFDTIEDEKITCITSHPLCPACMETNLSLRVFPDIGETHWYCKFCGTQWTAEDLINAMNMEE